MEDWQESRLKAALAYQKRGISIIPIKMGDKIPCIQTWKSYQSVIPGEVIVREWWEIHHKGANIALICGEISNLCVVDFDIYKDRSAYDRFIKLFGEKMSSWCVVKTPRGGYHVYFQHREGLSNLRGNESIDIKTNGGYVLAPPSSVAGREYSWYHRNRISPMPDDVFDWVKDLFKSNRVSPTLSQSATIGDIQKIQDGNRDESLFSVAWALKKGGMHPADIQYYLALLGLHACEPAVRKEVIAQKVQSAINRDNVKQQSVTNEVKTWVFETSGGFSVTDCYNDLGAVSQTLRSKIRVVLSRLKDSGDIEPYGNRRGWYRVRDTNLVEINWKDATVNALDIWLPFGLNQFFFTMPKNILVVSGSPDSGKTALLLNILRNNLNAWKDNLIYFSSEMGEMELKSRITNFENWKGDNWENFRAYERSHNFHDVIEPDALNIIDFMEISEDFAKIAGHMRLVHDRLRNGVAIIALQKKKGADMGRGAEFSLEKPRLYLTLDRCADGKGSTLTIQKAKNWRDPEENPNGKMIDFWIHGGCNMAIKESIHGATMREGEWYEAGDID